MELGWHKEELQPISTTYESYNYNQNQFLQAPQVFSPKPDQKRNLYSNANASSNFVQVGNMVQIVPKDLTEMDSRSEFVQPEKKSQILQVFFSVKHLIKFTANYSDAKSIDDDL